LRESFVKSIFYGTEIHANPYTPLYFSFAPADLDETRTIAKHR
jgi:ABC-type oligopeptide transport system substrate-binding subunit